MATVTVLCSLRCCIINVAKCAMVEFGGRHSTINIGNFTIAHNFSIQYEYIEVWRSFTKTEQSTSHRIFWQVSNVCHIYIYIYVYIIGDDNKKWIDRTGTLRFVCNMVARVYLKNSTNFELYGQNDRSANCYKRKVLCLLVNIKWIEWKRRHLHVFWWLDEYTFGMWFAVILLYTIVNFCLTFPFKILTHFCLFFFFFSKTFSLAQSTSDWIIYQM